MSGHAVLGFDVSPKKMGVGIVRDADGSPVLAGYYPLDGSAEVLAAVLMHVDRVMKVRELVPVFGMVERPFGAVGDVEGAMRAGVALGALEFAARMQWTWLTLDRVEATTWRSRNGIPPRAPKEIEGREPRRRWLKERAVERAVELGFDLPVVGARVRRLSDDAAEGALIARAAWLALENGDAVRIAPPAEAA